jgi:hypothetical protein
MQVKHPDHGAASTFSDVDVEAAMSCDGNKEFQAFFQFFKESTTRAASKAAARKMKKFVRQSNYPPDYFWFRSITLLLRADSKMLLWPSNPFIVLLEFVDPDLLWESQEKEDDMRSTMLHWLAEAADPNDIKVQENQLILGRLLIRRGANVNSVTYPHSATPLFNACHSANTTNLDFIQLLLDNGANPNIQNFLGESPLMCTVQMAPSAAKLLMEWPTTDVNLTAKSGKCILAMVRNTIDFLTHGCSFPWHPRNQFLCQQWRDIEKLLVAKGAIVAGIPPDKDK